MMVVPGSVITVAEPTGPPAAKIPLAKNPSAVIVPLWKRTVAASTSAVAKQTTDTIRDAGADNVAPEIPSSFNESVAGPSVYSLDHSRTRSTRGYTRTIISGIARYVAAGDCYYSAADHLNWARCRDYRITRTVVRICTQSVNPGDVGGNSGAVRIQNSLTPSIVDIYRHWLCPQKVDVDV